MGKRLISATDVREAAARGDRCIVAPPGECIVTPMAMDEALSLGIVITKEPASGSPPLRELDAGSDSEAARVVREVSRMVQNRLPSHAKAQDVEGVVRGVVRKKFSTPASSSNRGGPEQEAVVSQVLSAIRSRLTSIVDKDKLENAVRETVTSKFAGEATKAAGRPIGGPPRMCLLNAGGFDKGSGPAPVNGKTLVAQVLNCGAGVGLAAGFMEWEKAAFDRVVEFPEVGIVIEGELRLTSDGETLQAGPGDMVYFPPGAAVKYETPSRVKMACVNRVQ